MAGGPTPIDIHSEKQDSSAVIIGVVVGVGGFLLIGFIVFLALFLIKRKRNYKNVVQATELGTAPTCISHVFFSLCLFLDVTANASDPITSRHGNTGEVAMTAIATKPDIICTSVKVFFCV